MKYDKELSYEIDDKGCWNFTGAKDRDGYGVVKYDGRTYRAHKFSFLQNKGEVAVGLVVRHTCHNRACINPKHLLLGTQAENIADREERKIVRCAAGHALNQMNSYRYNDRTICKVCKAMVAARGRAS